MAGFPAGQAAPLREGLNSFWILRAHLSSIELPLKVGRCSSVREQGPQAPATLFGGEVSLSVLNVLLLV